MSFGPNRCYSDGFKCGFDPSSRFCSKHGAGLRKGPHWYDKTAIPVPSTALPTAGQRWAQIVRAAGKPKDVGQIKVELEHPRMMDPWTRKLAKALNVNFVDES